MDTLIWSGFIVGMLGSLHCVGMCGPIALALPVGAGSQLHVLAGRLLYNVGRVITYGLLGAASGLIGRTIAMAGFQQTLSWVAGSLIILAVIVPVRIWKKLLPYSVTAWTSGWIYRLWQRFFSRASAASLLVIGLLNGFLPCGLVYVALGAATVTGTPSNAALYMLFFGVGTIPVMFATSLFGPVMGPNFRRRLTFVLPIATVALGLILILRGMSLGIPYVSPKLDQQTIAGDAPCCH